MYEAVKSLINPQQIPTNLRTRLRPVKNMVKLALRPFRPRLVERAANPYATHIPVLVGLSRLMKIKHLLELGCGKYSTLTFLQRDVYQDLETLVSFENEPTWKEKIASLVGDDPRFASKLVGGAISNAVTETDLQGFDLIFIDDSASGEERARTIRKVIGKIGQAQIAVIHDYEFDLYRKATKGVLNQFRFDSLNPNTGVVWNHAPISKRQLRKLHAVIKKNCKHVLPDDIKRWTQICDGEL
jgi:predicted O-methyltransferase YrrM